MASANFNGMEEAKKIFRKSVCYKNVYKELKLQYGEKQAQKIFSLALEKLTEMLTIHVNDSKMVRMHTHNNILPGIAIYQAVTFYSNQQESMKFIEQIYGSAARKYGQMYRRCLKIPGLYRLVPKFFVKMTYKLFGEEAGFSLSSVRTDKKEIAFNITKCIYYETCKRWNCAELTHIFCESDDACYGNMHPKLIWGRTKTLGKGGDCCDFKITIK